MRWQGIGRLSVPGQTRPRQVIFSVLLLSVIAVLAVAAATLGVPPIRPIPQPAPLQAVAALVAPEPVLAAPGVDAGAPSRAGVGRELAAPLSDPRLGTSVAARVIDLSDGTVLYDRHGTRLATPASTTKLATTVAVLASYPADHRITTTVVAGRSPGEVVLVGGGDPTLSPAAAGQPTTYAGAARMADLAEAVRRAGVRVTRVVVDGSLFAGPPFGPHWDPDDVAGGYTTPITALTTDAGRQSGRSGRSAQPDLDAGRVFAEAVGVPGVPVVRGVAPAGATVLGTVRSAPLARIVEETLLASDNVAAEMLARQVAIAAGRPASFDGAAAAVRAVLELLGIDPSGDRLHDGSGLSPDDRLTPQLLVDLLRVASSAQHPELHPLFAGLPVAGYDGTLGDRYHLPTSAAGAGVIRAKTGTLTGVSGLAGVVQLADGRLLAFAFLSDEVPAVRDAEAALDAAASVLARCGCR
ncbi:MAG: D-alanyl-D-alanine carboxypeptidase/D-alanyl-D-alanine-endopeptidase [Actinobacteria bacterium]|nr:D-alanyl-D-alanine carboxypeptidase/D-alanyl-D-alanine-endopeptidase [Actinomycetota bacterium]